MIGQLYTVSEYDRCSTINIDVLMDVATASEVEDLGKLGGSSATAQLKTLV